jgi:hypothetical protein
MAAAIMGDAAVSVRSEKEHLVFKGICGERPAVAENYRLSCAPIVVINLGTVFGGECAHVFLLAKGLLVKVPLQ